MSRRCPNRVRGWPSCGAVSLNGLTAAVALLCGWPASVSGANRTWNGGSGTDFETAANWSALPSNNLTSDVGVFGGPVTANLPELSAARSISGLLFSTSIGGWSLVGTGTLATGSGGISTAGQTSGLNTVSLDLAPGAAQMWKAGTGGTLLFTGSITGSGGFPITFNDASNAGIIILSPAAGESVSLTGTNNTAFFLVARSGGKLLLGGDGVTAPATTGTNTVLNSSTGSSYGSMTITGTGVVRVNSGTWNLGDLARNGSSDFFSGTLEVAGGTLGLNGARYLGAGRIDVSGGNLFVRNTGSVYSNGGKFSLGSVGTSGTAVMNVTGGVVDLAQAATGNTIGTAISTRVTQTGGSFVNGVTTGGGTNGGTANTFTIGHSGLTSTGSGATLTYTAVNDVLASYTLSGGRFVSSGTVQGITPAGPGANGSSANPPSAVVNPGTENIRNFNFLGGTLAVGAFNATSLGYSSSTGAAGDTPHTDPAANSVGIGTLYNHGGTLAPGDAGTAGRTTVTGNYQVRSGALAIDIGGTTQATSFQSGQYDTLVVSGTATLAGNLAVSLTNGFVPSNPDVFTIVSAASVTGSFANAPAGGRVATTSGLGSFRVDQTATSVVLTDYKALLPPVIQTQPSAATVVFGFPFSLSVTASSDVAAKYQWRKNGIAISGANGSAFTIAKASPADSGSYDVLVTNPAGSVTSVAVQVQVNLFPQNVLGQRSITYDPTGVRQVTQAPPAGVHPRVYFNPEELPAIRQRLTNTAVGVEAMTMIRLYTDLMRRGRSLAYDSKPSTFKLMPDGTPRISNVGLYDKSVNYNLLVSGSVSSTVTNGTTTTLVGVANDSSTGRYALAGEMALEAFECLVDEGQSGVSQRAANLAAALDTWAQWVVTTSDFPGPAGATYNNRSLNQDRIGGHLTALAYDMAHPNMTQTQRDNVRKALAKLMTGYFATDNSDTDYTGVGMAPEAVATNHVTINSFRLITACAIEGEVLAADAGFTSDDLDAWFRRAMSSYHKFFTYGWFASGAPLEGMGKNYLYGAHMIPYARRGYDFFSHPHVRKYRDEWVPAVTQPFGFSFLKYDLLGGSGPNAERGRGFIESLDYTGMKWMYPDDKAADFAWRNYVLTEYKDGGTWKTFLDLRDSKFGLRSVYSHQLLPAAIFASDIGATNTWTQHNTEVQGPLDYLDREGGTLVSRSGHDPDSTALVFHVRQDMGGHTFADRNTFTLSALGRLFVNYNSGSSTSALEDGSLSSIVEIDGKSMKITDKEGDKMRIPSKLAAWTPLGGDAVFATGDATYAYSQEWWWNAYSSGPVPLNSGFTADLNTHNTFRRSGNRIPEDFGNTPFVTFPHWEIAGKLEGIQAKPFNPMRQVLRTIGLVRGAKPYALVIDDVRKDDSPHSYRWIASIPKDLVLVQGASLPAGADPAKDLVLEEPAATGNRRLLIRILNATGTPTAGAPFTTNPNPGKTLDFSAPVEGGAFAYTQTISNAATSESWKRLVIERSETIAPDFRILMLPFRAGDALPVTVSSPSSLSVTIGSQTDTFAFSPRAADVAGQQVTMSEFTLTRNGSSVLDYRNQIEPSPTRGPAATFTSLPAAPTGVTASAQPGPSIRLQWTDNSNAETAYLVERCISGSDDWLPLAATLAPGTTTWTDNTAVVSTAYLYRVRCAAPTGLSDYAVVTAPLLTANTAQPEGGIPGWWDIEHFGGTGVSGPSDDPDGDGANNLAEYAAGTDPNNASSVFKPLALDAIAGGCRFRFSSVPGRLYQIESAVDPSGPWQLRMQDIPSGGSDTEVIVPVSSGVPRLFLRAGTSR